jgi:cyanophycinase
MRRGTGALIIIGGHEDKQGDRAILTEVARRVRQEKGPLVVVTVATVDPETAARVYTDLFSDLGVSTVSSLSIRSREEAMSEASAGLIRGAGALFFTGGDQLRITSRLGGTATHRAMEELHAAGATVVGTSAGAAAMSETMIVSTYQRRTRTYSVEMAPGLGLTPGLVIDSHFAERRRLGRLMTAVSMNPLNLGVGIDEDTALILENGRFRVIGSGAVHVLDGCRISHSNVSEKRRHDVLSVFDLSVHVLGEGYGFELEARRPVVLPEGAAVERDDG